MTCRLDQVTFSTFHGWCCDKLLDKLGVCAALFVCASYTTTPLQSTSFTPTTHYEYRKVAYAWRQTYRIIPCQLIFKKSMELNQFNDYDDPPTLEDSNNEGIAADVEGAPRSSYASPCDHMVIHRGGLRIGTASHQAPLRKQAHAPFGLSIPVNPNATAQVHFSIFLKAFIYRLRQKQITTGRRLSFYPPWKNSKVQYLSHFSATQCTKCTKSTPCPIATHNKNKQCHRFWATP